jgi:hypothetical protein
MARCPVVEGSGAERAPDRVDLVETRYDIRGANALARVAVRDRHRPAILTA